MFSEWFQNKKSKHCLIDKYWPLRGISALSFCCNYSFELPLCSIWQDGLIIVVSVFCHIWALPYIVCYNGFHNAPKKVESFADLFITFSSFFLLTTSSRIFTGSSLVLMTAIFIVQGYNWTEVHLKLTQVYIL